MDLIYRYISVLINSLIVYLYFKIIFKVEIDNKKRLYYIVFSTLVVGTNLVLLLHSGGIRGLVSILLFILFANYFFKVKTGQAILGVGIVFVVATIGEVITYLILSGMGFSAAEIINNIGLNALSNFITNTVVVLFIFIYSILFYNKKSTSENGFLVIYIVATLILIAYYYTYFPMAAPVVSFPQVTVPLLAAFMAFSWLMFFLANKNLSFKKEENLRLISDVQTIQQLNEKKEKIIDEYRIRNVKLEAIGMTAGGIAHDFNNLLTVLLGNLSIAKMHYKEPEELLDRLAVIEEASMQIKDLSTQLLTFIKEGNPIKQEISIAKIIQDCAKFANTGANVKCETVLNRNLYPVEVDVAQMRQVFNNLILNAVQATSDDGCIRIRAENYSVMNLIRDASIPDGSYIKISVKDNGNGIAEDHLDSIFDPFFTTRANGSGLGLSTVKSIVERHGGIISVASKPGTGTTFTVYLPAICANGNTDQCEGTMGGM